MNPPTATVKLTTYGLSAGYAIHDDDFDCVHHVIGYRFVVWLSNDRVAAGFNTSPQCRPGAGALMNAGVLRVVVFDAAGNVQAKRDIPYAADGGLEVIAQGEAFGGPAHSLAIRLEEASGAKSGVLLLDNDLRDITRIDRFMETRSPLDTAIVFQQGFVLSGPRTYDIVYGDPPGPIQTVTTNWPAGAMSRSIGSRGSVFADCLQDNGKGEYRESPIIYANAHRRCSIQVLPSVGLSWQKPMQQDDVAESLGILPDGTAAGIVRHRSVPDRMVVWKRKGPDEMVPWFTKRGNTELIAADELMRRYVGMSTDSPKTLMSILGIADKSKEPDQVAIFDRKSTSPLVDRSLAKSGRIGIAPDGRHYATIENGELRIYRLPAAQ